MGKLKVGELEDQSFRNAVWFYREELRRVVGGENTKSVFGFTLRVSLRRYNILKSGGGKGNQFTVSAEAQALLMDFTR